MPLRQGVTGDLPVTWRQLLPLGNDFVAGKCEGNGWLGGSDAGMTNNGIGVTDPEAGSKFRQQSHPRGGVEHIVGGWYQNFDDGEPNDYPSGRNEENYRICIQTANGMTILIIPINFWYLVEYAQSITRPKKVRLLD